MERRKRSDITPKKQNTLDGRRKRREDDAISVSTDDDDETDEDDIVFVKEVAASGIPVPGSRTTVKIENSSPRRQLSFSSCNEDDLRVS